MGVNEKGFCVENSVISDMPTGSERGLGNGTFMKLALETCATIDEFEQLLIETNETGRRTTSNFGVIDAQGGAAIFETGHVSYVKFDANDPQVAPQGYTVRSNFTMTGTGYDTLADSGDLTEISSGVRYLRGDALWCEAIEAGELDHEVILRKFSRDMADPEGIPYTIPSGVRPTETTINRRTTASVGVFHGVKPGEDPLLTTMWVILGQPIFSIAVPCWVAQGEVAPELDGDPTSPFCSAVLEIKATQYEERRMRTDGLGKVWAITFPIEDNIFNRTERMLERWRASSIKPGEALAFHKMMATDAMGGLLRVKARIIPPVPR
jgi:hypothetical protein